MDGNRSITEAQQGCAVETAAFEKRLAKSITHYVYRNTQPEDWHADGVILSAVFYEKMYRIVAEKLETVVRYNDAYLLCTAESVQDIFSRFSADNADPFERYVLELAFGFHYGAEWDEPVYLVEKPQGALAAYVLGGEFSACCVSGMRLDDTTMCRLNKDVYNRIYTLLADGWLHNRP